MWVAKRMFYRVCIPNLPRIIYALDEPLKWEHQVHAEYPEASGSFAEALSTLSTALLENPAPNKSVAIESMMGWYRSIRDNQSDFTPVPVRYPIKNFDRVKPVQVFFEKPVSVLSTYKVDDKFTIIYADLLKDSLKSFDFTVWSAVVSLLFIFVALLVLRWLLNSLKEDNKQGNGLEDSPFFETFSHLIGQVSSNFLDRPGTFISFIMTLGFFLILVFYLNLMSTDLVVENKPPVIGNYRDIMDKENYTVGLLAGMPDVKEFEDAEPGTIQDEFWRRMKDSVLNIDLEDETLKFLERRQETRKWLRRLSILWDLLLSLDSQVEVKVFRSSFLWFPLVFNCKFIWPRLSWHSTELRNTEKLSVLLGWRFDVFVLRLLVNNSCKLFYGFLFQWSFLVIFVTVDYEEEMRNPFSWMTLNIDWIIQLCCCLASRRTCRINSWSFFFMLTFSWRVTRSQKCLQELK